MAKSDLDDLRNYLSDLAKGPLSDEDTVFDISSMLAAVWDDLSGSDEGGMSAGKLLGRMEKVQWEPPNLLFTVERHGGTVKGSSRAGLQLWSVSVEAKSAVYSESGFRQILPRSPTLDVGRLADEVVEAIASRREAPWLKWDQSKDRVRIFVSEIIPGRLVPKKTLEGRRRRFSKALQASLLPLGWRKRPGSHPIYERVDQGGTKD